MFHPDIIEEQRLKLEVANADGLGGAQLAPHSLREVDEWCYRLEGAVDGEGAMTRSLEPEEIKFILNELLICSIDYKYWLLHYGHINQEGVGVKRMGALKYTQELLLRKWAKIEMDIHMGVRDDALLSSVLKARQHGVSTLADTKLAHSMTFFPDLKGIMASAAADSTDHLWDIFTTALDRQPWWMKCEVEQRNNTFPEKIKLSNGALLVCAAGKSASGPSKEEAGRKRGQIGRGRTTALLHLSEISSWENPKQIDSALMPQVPNNPLVFGVFESTALGAHAWWQEHWKLCLEGVERNVPIFLPWYADPVKYRRRPPEGWQPSQQSVTYAHRIKSSSARWMDGASYSLSKEQLYWYEINRKAYERKDALSSFLEEFPADDEEAFQESQPSVFSALVQQRIRDGMRPLALVAEIAPIGDLQQTMQDFG